MKSTQPLVAATLVASINLVAMAADPQWTIQSLRRVCDKSDSECTWAFSIDNHAHLQGCKYLVRANHASRANSGLISCGNYTVNSSWSGQLGEGNGLTTLYIIDNRKSQIIWPAYTDEQLQSKKVIQPTQSYTPQDLPPSYPRIFLPDE